MRQLTTIALVFSSVAALSACDAPLEDGPALDPNAPRVHFTTPARGTFAGDVATIEVSGTAEDETGVTSVEVNGVTANVSGDGSWKVTVPVKAGTNLLHAIAKDAQGNTGKETRAVVAGPTQTMERTVPQAITASMSAQTFDALGRGASAVVRDADLTALVTPLNPVVDSGTTNGQPDCLYAQGFVTFADIGDADIKLIPQSGGLMLDATIMNPRVDMFLQWAFSCLDGSRNASATASKIRVQGNLVAGFDFFGGIEFTLQNTNVTIEGFNVDLGGVPQTIIDMFDLDQRMGPVIAWATEKLATPMLNNALASLNETKTVDVLGKPVDITVFPTRVDFDVTGALVELDAELRAQDATGEFVYVPNQVPVMDKSHGFQLAIADDAANQMLTSFWSAKGMDMGIDLKTGPYGEVGTLYDRVELSAKAPPFIDASGGKLKLTIGDLIATFKNGESIATQVCVNANLELSVTAGENGALRLDVGTPEVFVDILDENIDGANALSTAQFEAITSFALSRVVAVGSGSIGAIPLPSAGGVAMRNVSVQQQTGYLVVDGEVQ